VRIVTTKLGGFAYGYHDGMVDEVRIYDRVLGQSEVMSLAMGS
jgi:hypothetical protein